MLTLRCFSSMPHPKADTGNSAWGPQPSLCCVPCCRPGWDLKASLCSQGRLSLLGDGDVPISLFLWSIVLEKQPFFLVFEGYPQLLFPSQAEPILSGATTSLSCP